MPNIFDELVAEGSSKPNIFDELVAEQPKVSKVGLPSSYFDVGMGIASPGGLESKAWTEAGIPQTQSIAPELFSKLKFDINPSEPWYTAAAKAASNLAVGIPEFVSSPAGISGVYSGMVAPGTTKAFFAVDMIKNAVQQAPELMEKWSGLTPAQKASSAVDLVGTLALGAGLSKSVVGDVLKKYAPPAVKLARELETIDPEVKPAVPQAIRQVGVRIPEGPFAQPGIPELASAALEERMRTIQIPGREGEAGRALRLALEPPQIEMPQSVALAERLQGGGQAPYGKVSFMRGAEAPLAERTQASIAAETKVKPETVAKGVRVEAQDHPEVAAAQPELLPTLVKDELKLDKTAYDKDADPRIAVLKSEGLSAQQASAVLSGKKTAGEVVNENLTEWQDKMWAERDEGRTGTIEHNEAVQLAMDEATQRIQDVLEGRKPGESKAVSETVPAVDIEPTEQRRIETYGERYIRELGPEKARQRIEHLNKRTEEELANHPIDQNAIRRLQQEAQNIANALDKQNPPLPPEPEAVQAEPQPPYSYGFKKEGEAGKVQTVKTTTGKGKAPKTADDFYRASLEIQARYGNYTAEEVQNYSKLGAAFEELDLKQAKQRYLENKAADLMFQEDPKWFKTFPNAYNAVRELVTKQPDWDIEKWIKENEPLITKPEAAPIPEPAKPTAAPTEPAKPEAAKAKEVAEPTKGIITGRAIEKWADDTLRGGATHLGPDVLAAYLVKGAALIERGIINFAEWSARMIAEHGDKVKPHLRELFTAAQEAVKRTPSSQGGTLKSAREIVESKLQQPVTSVTIPTRTGQTTIVANRPLPASIVQAAQQAQQARPSAANALAGTTLDDVYRIFEPAPKAPTPIKQRGVNIVEAFRTGFSSAFRPINKLAEDIAKAYGGTRKDIAGIFEQLKGSSGKGEAEVHRFDRDVASLVKGQEKDFNAYMFLNRSLDRLRQDLADIQKAMAGDETIKLNRRSVSNYTIPQLESKLALLQQKLGPETLQKFDQAAQRYQEYMDKALRLQVESGRMSPEIYQAIKDGNQFYAPFKVMKYFQEGLKPEGTGRKIDTVADYTKAMVGIEDPNFKLGDMLGAARQNLLISRILADKAVAMRNIADLAAIDTQGQFVRRLKKGEDIPEGMGMVNVFENGEKVRFAVPTDVAEALQIYGKSGGGIISRFLEGASIPFKVGATMLNIPFQFSNLMADVPRTALVSKYGVRGVTDLVRYPLDLIQSIYGTMYSVVGKRPTKLYLDFLDLGAAGSAVQEYLTPKALEYRDPSSLSPTKRAALNILYTPAEFAKAIEQTSKVLGVKRAMRIEGVQSGAQLAKQIPEAITEIRRFSGSPDFGRQGKWTEQARLNLLYMFLNARIQGTVADLGRLTGRDGAKRATSAWTRIGIGVGVPSALLYYFNNSPEYKADYDNRSQKEKDNYWLIPKDSFITNEQGERMRDFWKIPKRESAKWIANMTESAMNFAQKKDPKAFTQFGQQMLEDISPVNIQGDTAQERLESVASSLNPLIKAPLELATGRDLYRHRQLVPDMMQKASPEEQYTDRTATAFKVLAKAMPDVAPDVLRSPIMLENITRNMTAGLITQFLPSKPVEGRGAIENISLLQRFQAMPYLDNEAFRKEMQALERESADEYLMRHRTATDAIQKYKDQSLPVILKNTGFTDPKLIRHVVDLWMAEQNGATSQDRKLIALPAKQRAEYVAKMLKPLTGEAKQKAILDLARKRVLTESVFQEMSQLPQ